MGCPTGTETGQEWDGKVTTEIQQHPDLVSVTLHMFNAMGSMRNVMFAP
jgi:hypothetical protein